MKYRIEKVIGENGALQYRVEKKGWFLWTIVTCYDYETLEEAERSIEKRRLNKLWEKLSRQEIKRQRYIYK